MKIIIVKYPYMDYEIGEVVDLGEEVNKSLVEFQRAVWAEDGEKKTTSKKKPARGSDGKFVSAKETEKPKKEVSK